jgi:hypothetical protein
MIVPVKKLACFVAVWCLVSCAGYQLGGVKPAAMAQVKSIAVPMFANATLHPRAEALATSAVADAFVQDGTYRIARVDQADAVLEGKLSSISYNTIRSRRRDTLHPEELTNTVTLTWTLRDARDRTKVIASGTSSGSSELFVSSNLQTARNNALPEALERAGHALVSRLANGY